MPLNSIGAVVTGAGNSGALAREARATEFEIAAAGGPSGPSESTVVRGNADDGPPQFVANYLSPFIRLDSATRLAILQFRDSDTGEVRAQYPSPRAVKEYRQNLPENSDLRPQGNGGGDQGGDEPIVIGSAQDKAQQAAATETSSVSTGSSGSSAPVETPSFGGGSSAPAFAAFGAAAASAVGGFGSRQLAVA